MIYKNLIFTKHALERMKKRSLDREDVHQTVSYPEKIINLEKDKQKFLKKISGRKIQVVITPANQNPKQKLIVSVWVRGEDDPKPVLVQVLISLINFIKWILKKIF